MLVASAEHMKVLYAAIRDESARMTDNIKRKDVRQVALLALTAKDIENLKTIAAAEAHTRNYAVLIRRLVAREAKELESDGRS